MVTEGSAGVEDERRRKVKLIGRRLQFRWNRTIGGYV